MPWVAMKANNGQCLNLVSSAQAIDKAVVLTLLDNIGTNFQMSRMKQIGVN